MLKLARILESRVARAGLVVGLLAGATACGQRGPLYLPTEPAAAHRATLPQVIVPGLPRDDASTKNGEAQRRDTPASTASPAAGSTR